MATDVAADSAAPSLFSGALRATTGGIITLITLIAFDEMAVSPALPTIARDLHGLAAYGWVFTGFLVANVVGMVWSGQICDRRGPRLPMAVGMLVFVVGQLTAGTATTMTQLIGGRVIQGISGGLMITAAYVVIGERYPEAARPKVFAAISSAWVLPSLVGPALSGLVTEHLGWRWVFLGLVPLVVAGGVLMLPVLRALGADEGRRSRGVGAPGVDTPGVGSRDGRLIRALAVAAGVAALEQAGQHPTPGWLGLGAVGLVALVWGLRGLLPAGTVRVRRGVPATIAMRGLLSGAFFGVEAMVPLSLTVQHGFGATEAGIPLACSGVTWAIGSWWQGRDVPGDDTTRRIRLARIGYLLIALGAVGVAISSVSHRDGLLTYPAWSLAGLGAGLVMSTLSVLMLRYTTDADRGADSASLQLADVTSSAITTGIGGALVAAAVAGTISYSVTFGVLDAAMTIVALAGFAAAGRLRAPVAASTDAARP